ncbi:hypothetical protein D3P09_02770 [Paenibacillus pinisoli]|uniref:Uncharacterized protein n=1 Tax=Paenibacillus pinisoli TaxID=1276110 RepID=A0A3A6PNJ4_9BACL|nr:hypothetical protein [Paenibacillus pinisoli]RJX40958.1 hypothetical protein D3P09_02770 [Paenibacillus pinisoli]
MNRRDQFNISALKFSDEVHDFIAQLSTSRRLSDWIAEQVEEELKRKGAPTGIAQTQHYVDIMNELQSIKQLLKLGDFQQSPHIEQEKQPVIQLVSSNEIANLIPENDLEYGF